jgi:predicted nucleic acid-binding protein
MPVVVSDASVLICLGAVRQLHLLREFYQTIIVPHTVWQEITAAGSSLPGAKEATQAKQQGWLKVQSPSNSSLVSNLRGSLDAGESEAIALAAELGVALLLIDEAEGRIAAKALGLAVTGTLGVLIRAKQIGKLVALKPTLDALIQQHGFRLGRGLYEQVLREIGETP